MGRTAKENPLLKEQQEELISVARAILIITAKDLIETKGSNIKKGTFTYTSSNSRNNFELKMIGLDDKEKERMICSTLSSRTLRLHEAIRRKYPHMHKIKMLGETIEFVYNSASWDFECAWARAKALEYISEAYLDTYQWEVSYEMTVPTIWRTSNSVHSNSPERALDIALKYPYFHWTSIRDDSKFPKGNEEAIKMGLTPIARKVY